jgi:glycosyltransferase involved in cell wall biosynthesis
MSWASFAKLDAVLFGEQYDFAPALALQRQGVKTIQWVDAYLAQSWRLLLKAYDQLWCITHRAESILLDLGKDRQTMYIGWGVPAAMYSSAFLPDVSRFDFFHSAGWIGLDARKGTDTVLAAVALMADDPPEMVIHCQVPEADAKRLLGYDSWPAHLVWEDADYPPPGIYDIGRIVVQPSKIEGIGLSLPEAMCAGRPVITVNAPPMTEFIDLSCGWLVDVDDWQPHVDGSVYQQAVIRPEALAKVMSEARAASDAVVAEKSQQAYRHAQTLFAWDEFKQRLATGLERIGLG